MRDGKAMQRCEHVLLEPVSGVRDAAGRPAQLFIVETALCSWTVIPSRSFACRQASWRSGESGTPRGTPVPAFVGRLPIRCPLELEADAVADVALCAAQPTFELDGRVGGILARRKRDDADVEPLSDRELHAARVAASPAASASKQRYRRRVRRESSTCRSVSAVPWRRQPARALPAEARSRRRCLRRRSRVSCLRSRRARSRTGIADLWKSSSGELDVLAAQRIVLVKLARLEADDPAAQRPPWEHQPAGDSRCPARLSGLPRGACPA